MGGGVLPLARRAGRSGGRVARATVDDWLTVLADCQPAGVRDTAPARARRTLALAILRGVRLDLLATGDRPRTTAAIDLALDLIDAD